jgi:DsbC/DsbD-like thiol-disulfide interchange protein
MFRLALACAALLAAPALRAGDPLADVVRVEVLDGGAAADGTHRAGLRLTLAPGWKTYWRAPGDAGIPPQFDWRGSGNVGALAITWPTPKVFDQNGLTSVGYADQVVLPLTITPRAAGAPLRLRGELDIGVCKDVCVPAQLRFDAALDPAAARSPAITAALAQRPFTAAEAGVASVTCALAPAPGGLRIEARIAMPHAGGREFTVIEPGDPAIWASETETRREGDTLIARGELAHVSGGGFALDRSALRITVLGTSRAVDIRGCAPG